MLTRRITIYLAFFLLAFPFCCPLPAQTDDPVDYLDEIDKDTSFTLTKSSFFFIDSLSQYSFDEIRDSSILKQFKPLRIPKGEQIEFPSGCKDFFNKNCPTLWIKSKVRNISSHPGTFFLKYYLWWGDYQKTYIIRSNDSLEIRHAGYYNPASKESPTIQKLSIITKRFKGAIDFKLQPQEEVTIYTQLNHSSSASYLIEPRIFSEALAKRYLSPSFSLLPGYLLFLGFLGCLLLIGVAISLFFRNTAYWLFSGYVLSIAVVTIFIGEFQALFLPEYPQASYTAFSVALCINPAFYAGFLYSFLNIAEAGRTIRWILYLSISSSILVTLFVLLLMLLTGDWYLAETIGGIYIKFTLVLLVPFLIFSLQQRRWDYYFIFAGSAFLLLGGLTFYLLRYFVDGGKISITVLEISIILQLLTFAAGLGYKMLRSEKEKIRLAANNEIKSKLYTNITHEFRTPLTVIMGITENIEGHDKEKLLISRNSKNLLQLINQMLDLSKLESGNMQLDLVYGNVVSYLRYLTESFHSMAMEKNLNLVFESEEEKIDMAFDEVKLQQVVFNLLSNAMKFTPEGGWVGVKTRPMIKEGVHYLNLSVQDSGIGMEQDQLPKIFDRFYQTDQSSTRNSEGTGIGLAFTKELIELMNGHIEVQSKLNKGSTFSLFIPIEKKEATKSFSISEKSRWKPTPPVLTKEEIVKTTFDTGLPQLLLIEDNKDVAHYIQQLLKKDYQVTIARNGRKGIEQALETLPDIIISDVMMPEKDGFEVCATLKADERSSHIPIILLTAKAQQSDKLTGLKYGADAYLMKPFDKEELFIRLRQLVQLRQTLFEKYSKEEKYLTAPPENEDPTLEDLFLQKVRDAIEAEIGNAAFSIPDLCQALLLSNMQLYRKLKALTGQTPIVFIRSYRLQKARHLLQTTDLNISEIAYDVGFTDPAYFSRAFKKEFGHSPSDFHK